MCVCGEYYFKVICDSILLLNLRTTQLCCNQTHSPFCFYQVLLRGTQYSLSTGRTQKLSSTRLSTKTQQLRVQASDVNDTRTGVGWMKHCARLLVLSLSVVALRHSIHADVQKSDDVIAYSSGQLPPPPQQQQQSDLLQSFGGHTTISSLHEQFVAIFNRNKVHGEVFFAARILSRLIAASIDREELGWVSVITLFPPPSTLYLVNSREH